METPQPLPILEDEATASIVGRLPGDEVGGDVDFPVKEGSNGILEGCCLVSAAFRARSFGASMRPPFELRLDHAEPGKRLDHVSECSIAGWVEDRGATGQRPCFQCAWTLRTGMELFVGLQFNARWPKSNAIVGGGKRGPSP